MSLSALVSPARSTFTIAALAGSRLRFFPRRPDRSRSGLSVVVRELIRCGLIFIVALIALSEPALAAERKVQVSGQRRNESGSNLNKQVLIAIEKRILVFTNNERSAKGLPAVRESSALSYLARGQSENMCMARSLEHESDAFPRGWKKFTDRMKAVRITAGGENIGYRTLREQPEKWAREVVNGWMKSPPHRKNILNPRWRYLGIGVRICADRIAYATQVFSSDHGRIP